MKIQVFWDLMTCRLNSGGRNLEPEDRGIRLLQSVIIGLSQGHEIYKRKPKRKIYKHLCYSLKSTLRIKYGDRIMDTWAYMGKYCLVKQISQRELLLMHN